MKISKERAAFMDNMLNQMMDYFIHRTDKRNPSAKLYAQILSIPIDLSEYLLNSVAEIGHNNNLLIAQRFGNGSFAIVSMEPIACSDFIESGAFTKYISENGNELQTAYSIVIVNTHGNANKVTVGNNNHVNDKSSD